MMPSAIYVWLVPSEEVLDQPGSWRIRKWDTAPFPEANFTLSEKKEQLPGVEALVKDWELHPRQIDSKWAAVAIRSALAALTR